MHRQPAETRTGIVMEDAAGLDAAKIAAIAWYAALSLAPWRDQAMRCVNSLSGWRRSLFGSADSLFAAPGNRPGGPLSLWHE
jgi:hypothetical protein